MLLCVILFWHVLVSVSFVVIFSSLGYIGIFRIFRSSSKESSLDCSVLFYLIRSVSRLSFLFLFLTVGSYKVDVSTGNLYFLSISEKVCLSLTSSSSGVLDGIFFTISLLLLWLIIVLLYTFIFWVTIFILTTI